MKKQRRVHHHIKNSCNGGHSTPNNLLYIKEDKEKLIHYIFGDRDLYDIIIFILRIARAKHYEEVNDKIRKLYKFL
jgi:hypothetical protein